MLLDADELAPRRPPLHGRHDGRRKEMKDGGYHRWAPGTRPGSYTAIAGAVKRNGNDDALSL